MMEIYFCHLQFNDKNVLSLWNRGALLVIISLMLCHAMFAFHPLLLTCRDVWWLVHTDMYVVYSQWKNIPQTSCINSNSKIKYTKLPTLSSFLFSRCQCVCSCLCEPASGGYELGAWGILSAYERAGAAAERAQSVIGGADQWLHRHRQHGGSPYRPLAALLAHHQAHWRWVCLSTHWHEEIHQPPHIFTVVAECKCSAIAAGMHGFVDVKRCDGFDPPQRRLTTEQRKQSRTWKYYIAAEEIVWDYAPNMHEYIDG